MLYKALPTKPIDPTSFGTCHIGCTWSSCVRFSFYGWLGVFEGPRGYQCRVPFGSSLCLLCCTLLAMIFKKFLFDRGCYLRKNGPIVWQLYCKINNRWKHTWSIEFYTCWGGNDFILHRLTTPGTKTSQVLAQTKLRRLTGWIFHTRTSHPEFTQAISQLMHFAHVRLRYNDLHKVIPALKPTGTLPWIIVTHPSQVRKSPKFMKRIGILNSRNIFWDLV